MRLNYGRTTTPFFITKLMCSTAVVLSKGLPVSYDLFSPGVESPFSIRACVVLGSGKPAWT